MDVITLRDYGYWRSKSAEEILAAVKNVPGGWAGVFPDGVPLWAHRVRNFFNHEPISLMRWYPSTALAVPAKPSLRTRKINPRR